MAENENTQAPEQQQTQEPVFQLQRCYLKDVSLEMPNAPEILLQPASQEPQVDIQFEVSNRVIVESLYDVAVRATITVKLVDRVIILTECKQSGIFTIAGLLADQVNHICNVLCPTIIYPYLRANLADLMTRANIPPVHLPEVNFEILYQQRLADEQAKAQGEQAPAANS